MCKSLSIAIFVFGSVVVFGQQETGVPPVSNSTTNSNNIELNNNGTGSFNYSIIETEEDQDSTVVIEGEILDLKEEKAIEKKGVKPGVAGSKRKEMVVTPVRSEDKLEELNDAQAADEMEAGAMEPEAPVPAMQSEQASYNFTYSYEKASQQRMQRSPTPSQQLEMDQAVGYFESNAPNSFEYHYFKYASGNYDVTLISHLQQAEALRPNNADVHVQMAAYNIIMRNSDSASTYMNKLIESGRLEENVMHYGEDILASAPQNGVLITHGFDDTYSVWKKQNVDSMRTDVTLISLDFLQSAQYRELLKEDGFVLPAGSLINVDYLKAFCDLNASKSISISMTTPKEYLSQLQSNLYVTGLVFEYHKESFNNYQRNDELWNTVLTKHLVDNATDEKSKQLSSNYLPMLLQLRKVYRQTGEEEKLKDVDIAADKVSIQCKKYEQVQELKKSY